MEYYTVPDEPERIAGLIDGEYDLVYGISPEHIAAIDQHSHLMTRSQPYRLVLVIFNKKEGLFKDRKARRALGFGLDSESILQSVFLDERFYHSEGSLFLPEQKVFPNVTVSTIYQGQDLDRARLLLEEAGYQGEEVVIITEENEPLVYEIAVQVQEMLNDIGMNARIETFHKQFFVNNWSQPEKWDLFVTTWDHRLFPHYYTFLNPWDELPGKTNDPQMEGHLLDLEFVQTEEEFIAVMEKFQFVFWDDLAVLPLGHYHRVIGVNKTLTDYENFAGPIFWNLRKVAE